MAAVILLLSTFRDLLRNALTTLQVGNTGIVYSCIKGSASAPEVNLMVGNFWLELVECEDVFG